MIIPQQIRQVFTQQKKRQKLPETDAKCNV